MDTEERLEDLADRLLARTDHGTVQWTPAEANTMTLTTNSGTVVLRRLGGRDVELLVLDPDGSNIARLSGQSTSAQKARRRRQLLTQLWDSVNRRALGIDTVLDGIISEIEGAPTEAGEPSTAEE